MAGAGIALTTNIDEVFSQLDDFVDALQTKVARRALDKLIAQAKTAGFRKIADVYAIGPRTMDKYATVDVAGDTLRATLTVKGKGFPLYVFSPRQTAAGVSVLIKGRRVLIPHAFIARMPSGHVGVFARGSYGSKGGSKFAASGQNFGRFAFGKKRLPINELYTFAPPDTLRNPDVVQAMDDRVAEQAPKVIRQELNFALRG